MERQIGNPSEHSRVANRRAPRLQRDRFRRPGQHPLRLSEEVGALRRREGRDDDALRANATALPQSSL